jgi:signal transduction histidine kinase
MPREILGKIFQPFFTTKEAGKGSGFGLYNARIFASNHGGKIGVHSHPGEGTTFNIFLPIVDDSED